MLPSFAFLFDMIIMVFSFRYERAQTKNVCEVEFSKNTVSKYQRTGAKGCHFGSAHF
jgi:hypothetical protein